MTNTASNTITVAQLGTVFGGRTTTALGTDELDALAYELGYQLSRQAAPFSAHWRPLSDLWSESDAAIAATESPIDAEWIHHQALAVIQALQTFAPKGAEFRGGWENGTLEYGFYQIQETIPSECAP